jgi:hypothetical protein
MARSALWLSASIKFQTIQVTASWWLSPDHAVYVGEALIPVKHLVDGSAIAQVQPGRVT